MKLDDEAILFVCKHFPYLVTQHRVRRRSRNRLTDELGPFSGNTLLPDQPRDRISFFWSSRPLSEFGLLALQSAVSHGHPTCLYTFDRSQLENTVPAGVILADADEILPRSLYESCLAKREIHAFSDIF